MEENALKRALDEWNYWHKKPETGFAREATSEIKPFLSEREVIAITGPRRAGKTTVALQLLKEFSKRESIEQVLYLNFEDPAFTGSLSPALLDEAFTLYRKTMNPSKKALVILDEVQAIKDWEKWVRKKYDQRENAKFIVTGSSSKLLSAELSTLLTGRAIEFEVLPLSLREYAAFKKKRINAALAHDYLREGAFPEPTLKKNSEARTRTLESYFDGMLAKDAAQRFKVREPDALKKIAFYALSNYAKEYSYNSLAKALRVSTQTAREYSAHLQEAYLLFQLEHYSPSLKERLARHRKVYCVDSGLRSAVTKMRFEEGRAAENTVYLELKRRGKQTYYWKEKREVDFVVEEGLKPKQAINVCYSNTPKKREFEGLTAFELKHHGTLTTIVTKEDEGERNGVQLIPLWKFLSQPRG